jgi:hypothetical protein
MVGIGLYSGCDVWAHGIGHEATFETVPRFVIRAIVATVVDRCGSGMGLSERTVQMSVSRERWYADDALGIEWPSLGDVFVAELVR